MPSLKISGLLRIVAQLPERLPLTDEFECYLERSAKWYSSQKEHLLGWLGDYDGPGAYGRKNPGQDARFFYNHFRCAPGLLWLAEGLGEDRETLERAISAVRAADKNHTRQGNDRAPAEITSQQA